MPGTLASVSFPPPPRQEIRRQLVSIRAANNSPMPDAAIDEMVDLACHAAECGRKAMLEVIDRASDYRVSITAVGIASSLMAHDIKIFIECLKEFATATGLHFEQSTIVAGGPEHG